MKRKPIQQFEMSFASEAFNLAGQSAKPIAAEPARIMAEMTPEERETVRAESKRGHIFAADVIDQGKAILPGVSRIHLTLCGSQAGRPLCDCDKGAELEAGAKFLHAVYAPQAVFQDARLCPGCLSEWNAAEPEPEAMPGLAPGSRWTSEPMAKALATMQGGAR